MSRQLDRIKETLDLYDPDHHTVVIGTAALALQGIKVPSGVPDVDTLGPHHYIAETYEEMVGDRFGFTTEFSTRDHFGDEFSISLEPLMDRETMYYLKPYQSFTEVSDERYDMNFYLAYARSIMIDNYRMLPAHEILKWKATIGREKDLNKVQKILSRRSIRNYMSPDLAKGIEDIATRNRRILDGYGKVRENSSGQKANHTYGYSPLK